MTSINEVLGMEVHPAIVWLAGFAIFLVILLLAIWIIRKLVGGHKLPGGRNRQPRLAVTEAAIVDEKRRLVLVRRDNVEHLVMIGGPNDIILEQEIIRVRPALQPPLDPRVSESLVQENSESEKPKQAKGFAASLTSGVAGGVTGGAASIGSTLKSAGKSVGDKAVDASKTVAEKGVDSGKFIADKGTGVAKTTVSKVGEGVATAADKTSGAVMATGAALGGAVTTAGSAVADTASTATQTIKSTATSAAETVQRAGSATVDTLSDATSSVAQTVSTTAGFGDTKTPAAQPSSPELGDDFLLNDEDLELAMTEGLDIDIDLDDDLAAGRQDIATAPKADQDAAQESGNTAPPTEKAEDIEDEMLRMLDELSSSRQS